MEERLDDAIHVLRNHAESSVHLSGAGATHGTMPGGGAMMLTHSSDVPGSSSSYEAVFAASLGMPSGSIDGHTVGRLIWSYIAFSNEM